MVQSDIVAVICAISISYVAVQFITKVFLILVGNQEQFDVAHVRVAEWAVIYASLRNHVRLVNAVVVFAENQFLA